MKKYYENPKDFLNSQGVRNLGQWVTWEKPSTKEQRRNLGTYQQKKQKL